MIRLEDRQSIVAAIDQAHGAGARLRPACELAGIDIRTLQRWRANEGAVRGDRRPQAKRPMPVNALSETERRRVLAVANEPRFCEVPPARIVPSLADDGVYLASESSFYRILREHHQVRHRGRTKAPRPARAPTTHVATGPGQVWCWDMTFLPTQIKGLWFYLYLILDLCSRKIIGWEVHSSDESDHAVSLLRRTALAEGLHAKDRKPVLHGDNGATLKATTVLAMLHWLGVKASYSRPRVSNDNAYAEALFRTLKYCPAFPSSGFTSETEARQWASAFVRWYNHEHLHSGINYVTPAQRHAGEDREILAARHCLYTQARERNPQRWSGNTRNWQPIEVVTLNPETMTSDIPQNTQKHPPHEIRGDKYLDIYRIPAGSSWRVSGMRPAGRCRRDRPPPSLSNRFRATARGPESSAGPRGSAGHRQAGHATGRGFLLHGTATVMPQLPRSPPDVPD
jgi:putative transposase